MLENPMLQPQYRYPIMEVPLTWSTTCCDVCGMYEATVQFRHTKLCDKCASEEGIKLL